MPISSRLCAVVGFLVYGAASNAIDNLARAHIASGFGFWNNTAGFDISQTLIEYSSRGSTYGRAFWVGLLNTLLVAGVGIVFATILGFVVGICAAVEAIGCWRKLPAAMSRPSATCRCCCNCCSGTTPCSRRCRTSATASPFGGGIFLNNRGLFLPQPIFQSGFGAVEIALLAGIRRRPLRSIVWARKRQEQTGRAGAGLVGRAWRWWSACRLPCSRSRGFPLGFEFPQAGRFNITGGVEVLPEFAALLFGLSIYTAAFIAEVVRAGILAVSRGQSEAAYSLGLRSGPTLRLIVVPQAMRVIIPPLTSQYLNLTKNSTLAVAIGYPDLVQVFTGTVLNQTGQAVEVVAITMLGVSRHQSRHFAADEHLQ